MTPSPVIKTEAGRGVSGVRSPGRAEAPGITGAAGMTWVEEFVETITGLSLGTAWRRASLGRMGQFRVLPRKDGSGVFTGIIERVGVVRAKLPGPSGLRMHIDARGWSYRAKRGDSVAISGACLTSVADVGEDGLLLFDAVPETLAATMLGGLEVGARVNLESAATVGTLLGGHLVQGHVDGCGRVVSIVTEGEWRVRIAVPSSVMGYLAPKGSVCLDGVSLTLASVDVGASAIEVALIPVTLQKTTLAAWRVGQQVNMEADSMAKTIVHYLRHFSVGGMSKQVD